MVVPSFSPKDFGKAAGDYAAYRKGFPSSFFERLLKDGVGKPGQRLLDLGTGPGALARGFARQGAAVTGLDISPELIEQARKLGKRERVEVEYVLSKAESTTLAAGSFDAITAGQSWLWFDGPAVLKECLRLLKPGGLLVIAYFDYLPNKGNVAARTEGLILEYNPSWPLAGWDGKQGKWRAQIESAGFRDVEEWFYDEDVSYTHEEWRGRMRTCNGVLAIKDESRMRAFDEDLAGLLKKEFPGEPLQIPHRIFVITGRKP